MMNLQQLKNDGYCIKVGIYINVDEETGEIIFDEYAIRAIREDFEVKLNELLNS